MFPRFYRLGGISGRLAAVVLGLLLTTPALAQKTAIIGSTASVAGETESCGCKKKDLGGLSRRATLIAERRAETPAFLLVDAGNFGSDKVETDRPWTRTRFQWDMMAKLGYDAVTPGSYEMTGGRDNLLALFATQPGIQVVSANITDKSGKRLWPESAVIEKGGIRFGVTGVTSGAYYSFNLARGKQKSDDFSFEDETAALERVIPRLREQSDVVVVLLQTGASDARQLVQTVAGIDVAVAGHNPGYLFTPDEVGRTLLVRGGKQGQYMSFLELTLGENNQIVDHDGVGLALGENVTPDAEYQSIVDAFNTKHGFADAHADAEAAGTNESP